MVCLERWMRSLFLLVMFSAAPLCAENVSPPSALKPTNCSDPLIRAPCELPELDKNGNKIKSTETVQETPHLINSANNSDVAIDKPESTLTNANVTRSTNNSNSAIDNAESSNASKIEIKTDVKLNSSNTTDTKSDNNTPSKGNLQDKKIDTDGANGDGANIAKVDASTVSPSLNNNSINQTDNANSSKIDTEVPDMNSKVNCLPANQIPDTPPNITYNETQKIDKETELIEDGQNTEDILRNSTSNEKLSNPGVPLVQGQLAAILAGVFVVISVTAYVGLLSWRDRKSVV